MKFDYIKFSVFSIALLFIISNQCFAHFGSKGPFGGHVNVAATYKDSAVYIGTNEGGVYFSSNSKLVGWTARPVGLKSGKITAIVHSGKYLFAGTADSGVYIYTSFVGSDRYWNKINNGLSNKNITSLVAIDSSTVMAGTDGGGIFLTTNKGASWSAVNNSVLHHLEITALVKAGKRIIHASFDGGLYASDNNGTSWIDFNDAQTNDKEGTIALSYNETNDQLLVVNKEGLFVSGSVSTTTTPAYALAETGLPADYEVISISNNGTNWYLATNKGIFTSTAGTLNWTAINNGFTNEEVSVIIPFKTGLVAGTKNDGIFKSPNPVTTWTAMNTGFNNLRTYSIATAGTNIVIAATEKGVFVSKDLASTYKRANTGLTDSLHVNDITFADFCVLAATEHAGVFITADTGKIWTAINNGLTNLNIKKVYCSNMMKYAICSTGILYAVAMHSSAPWASIQYNLPSGVKPTSLAFYGNKLLLSTASHGVFIKTTGSTSWTASNTGLTNLNATSVTTNGPKLFIGTAGSGVFVSDTNTINWSATSKTAIAHTTMIGLNGDDIQAMDFNAGYVYASYKGGLLATSDNGATWIAGGNQFNVPSYADINKIAFTSGSTGRVFVTTPNNGLYSNALSELPLITGIDDETFIAPAIISIYPNPCGGRFNVRLNHVSGSITGVSIYDYAGKLLNTFEYQAHYQVNYPAGLYIVRVTTSKGDSLQKLVIQ